MIVLVGFYNDPMPARAAELLECLRRNLDNPHVEGVHVFVESGDPARVRDDHGPLRHPKATLVPHGRRVTFHDLFGYANRHLAGRRVAIANSDIYFDHTLARLDAYALEGQLLCLSRWEADPDGRPYLFEHPFSQDVWAFQAPLRPFPCDWFLGLPGCENRLAHEAARAGLRLSNPSRSVRAHHLHQSQVRHYTERQRVGGEVRGVAADFLDAPWLWWIVPGAGPAGDLRRTLDALSTQPSSTCVVSPSDAPGDGEAMNRAAATADPRGSLCFLDAGVAPSSDLSVTLLSLLDPETFVVSERLDAGGSVALACPKGAFERVGGLDGAYHGARDAIVDLRAALTRAGLRERTLPATALAPSAARRAADDDLTGSVDASYRRLKSAVVGELGDCVTRKTLGELRRGILHRHLSERGDAPAVPPASVVFRENMGFSVAALQLGASSHNNDPRPFSRIPPVLVGWRFTQVVASRVTPITVEFRTAGKLYVLVGTDWDGYHVATRFLRPRAYREPMERAETTRGSAFEVWSMIGDEGDALVLPTQVMLVAGELTAAPY